MLIGSVQNLNTRSLRSQNGFLRSPGAGRWQPGLSFVLKKGLAATTSRSAQASAESFKASFVSQAGRAAVWTDGNWFPGSQSQDQMTMVLPCILSPWCSLLSLSRPSKSPHDRCWPLKARPRHRHWLIIDLVLGKIGTGRRRRSWERIAMKVQHGRDLHVPWNIGTNWNIEEEKFHNFIDGKAEEEGRS